MFTMNENDIRKKLHKFLHNDYNLIIDEFGVCGGETIIDIVGIKKYELIGYEIKSAKDNLLRLPQQVCSYNRVFNKLYLVTIEKHLENAIKIIPDWWGVILAKDGLITVREAGENNQIDSFSLAQILWKQECIDLLAKYDLIKGHKSKPRFKLWRIIAENLPLETIQQYVIETLLTRVYMPRKPCKGGNSLETDTV